MPAPTAELTRLSAGQPTGYNNADYNVSTNPYGFGNGGHIANYFAMATDLKVVANWVVTEVTPLAPLSSQITALGAITADITALSAIAADVTALAAVSSQISALFGVLASISTLAARAADIALLGPRATDIGLLADIQDGTTATGAITTVAAASTAITNVSAALTAINAVFLALSNINTLAGIAPDVSTAAANAASITTVATNVTAITTSPTNIAAIIAAPAQASAAAASAVTAANAAAALQGTSTSSLVIATGSKSFTTQASKQWPVGAWLLAMSAANPTINYMFGQVTSYSGTALVLNVTAIGGSGTYADWTIAISGLQGAPAAGSGNTVGAASSVAGNLPSFGDGTGKLLADSGVAAALVSSALQPGTSADNIADGTTNKAFLATERTKLSGIATSADVTSATNVGSSINGAAAKTTPVDADTMPLIDSAAANVLKKVTWANIKATWKTYTDSLYSALGHVHSFISLTGIPTTLAGYGVTDARRKLLANTTYYVGKNLGVGTVTIATPGVVTIAGHGMANDAAVSISYLRDAQVLNSITIATPGVFNQTSHGYLDGQPLTFKTTGALPTGLVAGTTYYVIAAGLTTNQYQVSATFGGAAVNTSGTQSGTHYASKIALFPTGLAPVTRYYARNVATNTFELSLTPGGASIATSGVQRGTLTFMTGSDSNDGLTDTVAGALLSRQKAIDLIVQLDHGNKNITVQVCDGFHIDGQALASYPWAGGSSITFSGNTTAPDNCVLNSTSQDIFNATGGAYLAVQGFTFQTFTSGNCLVAYRNSLIALTGKCIFGGTADHHTATQSNGRISMGIAYEIAGNATTHHLAQQGGYILANDGAITITGSPAWSLAFAYAETNGGIELRNKTFTGSATGKRYLTDSNGLVDTAGASETYLPGSIAGTSSAGGVYDGTGVKRAMGTYSHDAATATGAVAITGLGFRPGKINFHITLAGGDDAWAIGECIVTNRAGTTFSMFSMYKLPAGNVSPGTGIGVFADTASAYVSFTITATSDDGFTLSYTKVSTPVGTLTINYVAEPLF